MLERMGRSGRLGLRMFGEAVGDDELYFWSARRVVRDGKEDAVYTPVLWD